MAGKKISELPAGTQVSGPELFPAVQSATTKKFTLSSVLAWVKSQISASSIGAQPTITASGILKGDGGGGVSAAVAGTDYATPAQLAYVESGTTASRTYVVGECFCWNGLLYQVTSAISSGQPLNPGSNCEAVPEGGLNNLWSLVDERAVQFSYMLAAGKSLTISPQNNSSSCSSLCMTNGAKTDEMTLTQINLYSRNSRYHVIKPILTGGYISITTASGVCTIKNNHPSHSISVVLCPVKIVGQVYLAVV